MAERFTSDVDDRDFFISYTGTDQQWAEWIAWELEQAGYTVVLQAWDFGPGSHFLEEMHMATQITKRTIVVLSNRYSQSKYTPAEWQEAFRTDPQGTERRLLIFRVEDCARPGLLAQIVSEDLFAIDQDAARVRLLDAVRTGRRKPPLPPGFPGVEPPDEQPTFPGRLVQASEEAAIGAGGPLVPENPWAVAMAWWYAILNSDSTSLRLTVTPESTNEWRVDDLQQRTTGCGLATGVFKTAYDVAYVRLVEGIRDEDGPQQVIGGEMQISAKMISLVLRPELNGWKVHKFGQICSPNEMPRTWNR